MRTVFPLYKYISLLNIFGHFKYIKYIFKIVYGKEINDIMQTHFPEKSKWVSNNSECLALLPPSYV